jgi:hypothetical protein
MQQMTLRKIDNIAPNQSEFNTLPFLYEKESYYKIYYSVILKMTPEQKVAKVIELTELSRNLMKEGLKIQFPNKTETEIQQLYLDRLRQCHNSNY